jgi:hypothetical protein
MSRVRVEKIGASYYLEIDGTPCSWGRLASNLLTNDIQSNDGFSGIFSVKHETVFFFRGKVELAINFNEAWKPSHYPHPLAEIRRRVRLVQEAFAKAEAEKEVWEGVVGDLPLVTEKPLFDVLHISWSHNPPKVFKVVEKSIPHSKAWHWVGGTMLNNFVIVPTGRFEEGDNY